MQNNLAYNNLNHGMALYNNVGPYVRPYQLVRAASSSPQQISGPEVLPIFGSHNDVVNNTILMNNQGRSAPGMRQRQLWCAGAQQHPDQ